MFYPTRYGQNKNFPSPEKFEIRYLGEHVGKGVVCVCSFKKGDLVAEITGDIFRKKMLHTLQISTTEHLLDRYFSGYFLHSCNPNVSVSMQDLVVRALCDLHINDILYIDYAETEDVLFRQFECRCDSQNCRGWITGRKEGIMEYDYATFSSYSSSI